MNTGRSELVDARFGLLGFTAATAAIVWSVVAFLSLHGALPRNGLEVPGESAVSPVLRQFLPQGWAFFTKSPRDDEFAVLRRVRGRWIAYDVGPQDEVEHLFGFRRTARATSVEAGYLAQLTGASPRECRGDVARCLDGDRRPKPVVSNVNLHPIICGDVAFVSSPPEPWTWRRALGTVAMPEYETRAVVRCE